MAHTKAQKAAKGNKDSVSKRLGVKIFGDQRVGHGNIILKQRGMEVKPGKGAAAGKDYTLYATKSGKVTFITRQGDKYVTVNEV